MSQEKYRQYSNEPEQCDYNVAISGNGTSVPTKLFGRGITVGRTGVGVITLTFGDFPGVFLDGGGAFSFQAISPATPAQLAGFSVVGQAPSANLLTYTFNIFNGSLVAADIQTGQILNMSLPFKASQSSL